MNDSHPHIEPTAEDQRDYYSRACSQFRETLLEGTTEVFPNGSERNTSFADALRQLAAQLPGDRFNDESSPAAQWADWLEGKAQEIDDVLAKFV